MNQRPTSPCRTPIRLLPLLAALLLGLAPGGAGAIETTAREAFIVDYATGTVLLDKNADQQVEPASMSKMMTAYMAFDALKQGRLKLDDTLPVTETAWRMGGSKMFVELNNSIKVEDLLRGIIVQSGNDACIVVAEGLAGSEEAFAEQMNEKAIELGLTNSHFTNSTGWPDPEHLTTARDLATVAKRIIQDFPEYYHYYAEKEFTYHGIRQGNRNPLLYKNVGADGLKTGHTEAAGYGLTASAERSGRRIILVIHGIPDGMQSRADEATRLMEWAFREFDNYKVLAAGETIERAPVWMGASATVPLVSREELLVTLPRGAKKQLEAKVVFEGPIPAPIEEGQQIAKLVISAPDFGPVEAPLYAGSAVDEMGFGGRLVANVKHLIGISSAP